MSNAQVDKQQGRETGVGHSPRLMQGRFSTPTRDATSVRHNHIPRAMTIQIEMVFLGDILMVKSSKSKIRTVW
jgi:hypothetical protein